MKVSLMRIEGKNTQGSLSAKQLLEYVGFGNLRPRSGQVLTLDSFKNLVSVNRDVLRRGDADLHVAWTHTENGDLDLIPDDQALTFLPREY